MYKKLQILIFVILVMNWNSITHGNDNMVAWYPFNGNAQDESGNAHHGIVDGATLTTDRFNQTASAYHFDGIDDFITIPLHEDLNITDDLTICAWVYLEFDADDHAVIDKHERQLYKMNFSGTRPSFEMGYATGVSIDEGIPPHEWHFVVGRFVLATNERAIYVDGELKNSRNDGAVDISTNELDVVIGKSRQFGQQYFKGKIDEVRIFNRALSENEIMSLYSDLVAWYPFNGNANDVTGNGHDGVVHNAELCSDLSGHLNSAYFFDGSNEDYINIENNIDAGPHFTISLWCQPLDNAGDNIPCRTLFRHRADYRDVLVEYGKRSGIDRRIMFIMFDENGTEGFYLYSNTVLQLDNWHHVLVTYDGQTKRIYIDGSLDNEAYWGKTITWTENVFGNYIGREGYDEPHTNYYSFPGCIDNVRIYRRVLTNSEINQLYIDGQSPINVKLIFFDVTSESDHVTIRWKFENEQNIAGYNILRSDQQEGIYTAINHSLVRSDKFDHTSGCYVYEDSFCRNSFYKIECIDLDGNSTLYGPQKVAASVFTSKDKNYKLIYCYPNPFNSSTLIKYHIEKAGHAAVSIFDALGSRVKTLTSEYLPKGEYSMRWNGDDDHNKKVASGVYFLSMQIGDNMASQKILMLE